MPEVSSWLPIVIGAILAVAICVKIFKDPTVSNYLGYLLVAAVVLCALPTVQNFTYKGQLGEISTVMRTDIAGQSANLGRDVNELGKKIDAIATRVNAATDLGSEYARNKGNTILIFYASSRAVLAEQMRDYLLGEGYKASATFTDFTELASIPTAGTTRITFTAASSELAVRLKPKLTQKFPQIGSIVDRIIERMNSGDVQLQLF